MSKKIVSFYKFKKLSNIDNLRNIIFRFMKKNSVKHFPAKGDATLSGVIVDCDIETGLAKKVNSYIFGDLLNKNR